MVILIDTEKALNRRQYTFMTKNIQQTRNRRKLSQNDKSLCVSQISVVVTKYLRKQLKMNQHFIWLTVLVVQWLFSLTNVSHCRSRATYQRALQLKQSVRKGKGPSVNPLVYLLAHTHTYMCIYLYIYIYSILVY